MSYNGTTSDTDYELEDISSFSSVDSYKPEPFTGLEHTKNENLSRKATNASQGTYMDDATSKHSGATLKKLDSLAIEKVVTQNAVAGNSETIESLKAKGLDMQRKAIPDYNAPLTTTGTNQFPEEYRLETDTGLVKMKTLETLKRKSTQLSRNSDLSSKDKSISKSQSNKSEVSDIAQKINMAVERNKKEIAKYQKHKSEKGIKGFFHRMFD